MAERVEDASVNPEPFPVFLEALERVVLLELTATWTPEDVHTHGPALDHLPYLAMQGHGTIPVVLRMPVLADANLDEAIAKIDSVFTRVSVACGRVLGEGSTGRKRYCSPACRKRAHRERKERRPVEKFAELLR